MKGAEKIKSVTKHFYSRNTIFTVTNVFRIVLLANYLGADKNNA